MSAGKSRLQSGNTRPLPTESFLQRFHRLKSEARREEQAEAGESARPPGETVTDGASAPETPAPTDADMPPIESLTPDSDYRGFLSAQVSESLRRAALRKLFHSAAFNVIDELDDYAEDFTRFQALGDIITADMRHRIEREARRLADASDDGDAGSGAIAGENDASNGGRDDIADDSAGRIDGNSESEDVSAESHS